MGYAFYPFRLGHASTRSFAADQVRFGSLGDVQLCLGSSALCRKADIQISLIRVGTDQVYGLLERRT